MLRDVTERSKLEQAVILKTDYKKKFKSNCRPKKDDKQLRMARRFNKIRTNLVKPI